MQQSIFSSGKDTVRVEINFLHTYFSTNLDTKISYQLGKAVAVLKHPKFNRKKPIMLYSHGYGSSSDSVSSQAIVKAYIENGNYNIFLIDWRELASGLYTFVASSLEEVYTISQIYYTK